MISVVTAATICLIIIIGFAKATFSLTSPSIPEKGQ